MSNGNIIDLSSLSKQYSSRDLPSHQKLKYREIGQVAPDEQKNKDKKELRKTLEEKEKSSKETKRSLGDIKETKEDKEKEKAKKQKVEAITNNLDADEPIADSDDNESEEDDDDDDDDTAELLAELERIKKERASEQARLDAERQKEDDKIRVENILKGNPLLNAQKGGDFKVKRRWDDDVVFKNCAKSDDKNVKKAFINDTLRSEFHKKFMERYIK